MNSSQIGSSALTTLSCCFVNQIKQKIVPTNIEVKISIANQEYNNTTFSLAISDALTNHYPGITSFELYVLNKFFQQAFNSDDVTLIDNYAWISKKDTYFTISKEILNKFSTVFIKITNIYDEENFTTIQKVQCNFVSPEGNYFSLNILLPNSLSFNIFENAINSYLLNNNKITQNERAQLQMLDKNKQIVLMNSISPETLESSFVKYDIVISNFIKLVRTLLKADYNSTRDKIYNYFDNMKDSNVTTIKPIRKDFFKADVYFIGEKNLLWLSK